MSHEPATDAPGHTPTGHPPQRRARSTFRARLGAVGRWLARILLALLLLIGAATTLLPQGRGALRSAMLLPALVFASQPAPLTLNGEEVRHTSLTVPSQGGPVYLDVYEPVAPPPPVPGAREGVVII